MKNYSRKRKLDSEPTPRWTRLQRGMGYLLMVFCFLSLLIHVFQSIEVKNVAYATRDLMQQKQALLKEKHQLELELLERQSFKEIDQLLDQFDLPLRPGPGLEIVLTENELTSGSMNSQPSKEESSSWRNWLARLNQAHAMMTSDSYRSVEWRIPVLRRDEEYSVQSTRSSSR